MTQTAKLPTTEIDVLVIGAGFSGLYCLYALRNAGFSVKIFEAGSGLGGTWYWNSYPGARTDSDFSIYQYSMEELWKDWNWTERFPARDELVRYFDYADKKLDLSKDILFDTRMTGAHFDTKLDRWIVSTENGIVARPRFMILCTGFASKPYVPAYKGLEKFKGVVHHTSRWPKNGLETKGLRVAVIGTGATGVQIVQETAAVCQHLTVFQRTPNMAPELFKHKTTTFAGFQFDMLRDKFMELPKEKRTQMLEGLWEKGGLIYWLGGFVDILADDAANKEVYDFWRAKVLPRLKDPKLQAKLAPEIPPHPFGTKRHSLEQNQEITETGIKTADGQEHTVDVLILATGFDAITGSISQINIEGTDGVMIGDKWKKKLSTYLGLTSANYPNMFFPYGPHGPTAFCNGPTFFYHRSCNQSGSLGA